MSDSPQEENKPSSTEGSNKAPSADKSVQIQVQSVEKKIANKDTNHPSPVSTPKQSGQLTNITIALSVLSAIALVAFGWVAINQWQNRNAENRPAQPTSKETTSDQPVSILPAEPGGVTVLEKQPEPNQPAIAVPLAPVAQGADIASGFAMDIGSADSVLELSRRFAETALLNGEENFTRLEPRTVLRETVTGLEARLLIGPFETESAAAEACNVLILGEGLTCTPSVFEGELISRD